MTIITVWYDTTTDGDNHAWIVDEDDGDTSNTLRICDTRDEAVEWAKKVADERGLELEVEGD